jgi:hypothetical protein
VVLAIQSCSSLPCVEFVPIANAAPWQTSVDLLEYWTSGFLGVPAYQGSQFVELNSTTNASIFQVITGLPAGAPLAYEFAHRGRHGTDTVKLTVSDLVTSAVLFTQDFASSNINWSFYAGSVGSATGNALKLEFTPVIPAGTTGNFLDAVVLDAPVATPAVPSPVPLLGAGTMVAISRRLRRRIKASGL